jgi:hypothetical protein
MWKFFLGVIIVLVWAHFVHMHKLSTNARPGDMPCEEVLDHEPVCLVSLTGGTLT